VASEGRATLTGGGRLQLVALAGDLGRLSFRLEPVVGEGAADLVGGRGQEPGLGSVGGAGAAIPEGPDRAEGLAGRLDPDAVRLPAGAGGPGGPGLAGEVDADPLGRLVARHPSQYVLTEASPPLIRAGIGRDALTSSSPSAIQTRAIRASRPTIRRSSAQPTRSVARPG
jgi:hypothetical protein